jgi:gliding motility-associated-like protein
MSNKLNPFEEQLRKAANSHEVPYDASQWDKLEKQLDQAKPSGSLYTKWGIAAIAAMVIAVSVFQLSRNESETNVSSEVITITENTVVKDDQEIIKDVAPVQNQEVYDDITHPEVSVQSESLADQNVKPVNIPSTNTSNPQVSSDVDKKVAPIKEPTNKKPIETTSSFKVPGIVIVKTTVCSGEEFEITLTEDFNEKVIWDLGNGETVMSSIPGLLKYTFHEKGYYEIKAFFPNHNVYSESVNLVVNPRPDASFEPKENLERGMVPVVYLASNTGGELAYSWNLGDGTMLTGEGVSHTYTKAGDYEISLRVVNKYGCQWINYRRYTQEKEFNLLAPNSFSPNGDGVNDMWYPVALTSGYFSYQLSVYDRNSNLVFESSDPQNQFDGRVDGTLAPSGEIFIWKATTLDNNGVRQAFGGTVISMY